jgi:crotonobetainyl-CoA:carnitine CoA-transferase CaiB-like acyl-CoA transferase
VDRDGEGQLVDVALYESVFALTESLVSDYELTGRVRTRTGGGLPGVAPSNAYPTRDGHMMMIAANADRIWARLTEVMGRPELARDERFATHVARGSRIAEVDELVAAWTSTLDFHDLDDLLSGVSVPHGLIYRAPDILQDPHYEARQMIRRIWDGGIGREVPMPAVVPRLSRTPGTIRWAGAAVGADSEAVLGELGLGPTEATSDS